MFLCASSRKTSKQVDQIYSKTWDAEWPQQDGLLWWTEHRDFVSVGWWWCPFLNSLGTMTQHGKHDPTWTKYYIGELQRILPSLQSWGIEKALSVFINCLINSLVERKIIYKWFVLKQYNSFLRSVLYSTKLNPHASQKRDLESSTLLMQLTTVSLVLKLLQQIEENTTFKANVKSRNVLTLSPIGWVGHYTHILWKNVQFLTSKPNWDFTRNTWISERKKTYIYIFSNAVENVVIFQAYIKHLKNYRLQPIIWKINP